MLAAAIFREMPRKIF
jgi:hypothetical protein